jgi:hypothetical protein
MIKTYSQRLMPPYSGQAQIAESKRARAITIDGETWEFHFLKAGADGPGGQRSFFRVAYIRHDDLVDVEKFAAEEGRKVDARILELATFLQTVSLPFPATDRFEYWLLDPADGLPLALVFSCSDQAQMASFPAHPEWTALPAAVMPIDATLDEQESGASPVNYRFERQVAARSGDKPVARWFKRTDGDAGQFPACLVREDWSREADHGLCQRYINRQSTRLLMLHGLPLDDRRRLELSARAHPFEVARFHPLYPEIADPKVIKSIRVEARLRDSGGERSSTINRRDGVLYI